MYSVLKKVVVALGAVALAVAANATEITINGNALESDVASQIIDGTTLVPMRAIFESLEPAVVLDWNRENQIIRATWQDNELILGVGVYSVILNGEIIDIPVAPRIVDDRTLVPLRVVAESFGARVEWNSYLNLIEITLNQDEVLGSVDYVFAKDFSHLSFAYGLPNEYIINLWLDAYAGMTELEQAVFDEVNRQRASNGISPISHNFVLATAARYRTAYLGPGTWQLGGGRVHVYGSHSTDGLLRAFARPVMGWGFISATAPMAEDSAVESVARALVDVWLNLPGHWAIMLDPLYTNFGIGAAFRANGDIHVYGFFLR